VITTVRLKVRGDGSRVARARWPWAAAASVAVIGIAAATTAISYPMPYQSPWAEMAIRLWGVALLIPAVLLWLRAPSPRPGQMLVTIAGVYYLQFLRSTDHPVLFAAGFCLGYLWTGIFEHMVLTWPTGRITDRVQRVVVPAGYLASVGGQVFRYLADHPRRPSWTFGVTPGEPAPTTAAYIGSALSVAFTLGILAIVVRRWVTSNRLRRRPTGPIWVGVSLAAVVSIAMAVAASVQEWRPAEVPILLTGLGGGLMAIPAVYAVRLLRNSSARWDLATVALDIEDAADPLSARHGSGQLQKALADAVGDPSLRLVYRLRDGSHVDIHGRATSPPLSSQARAISPVVRRGRLLALIEHDQALVDDRSIADATSAAAGIAIENAHLHATMQAQIEQIRASRHRLATAALDERQRIQRDLHDGAQQSLLAILVLLDVAGHHLASADTGQAGISIKQAHERLAEAISMLREFTEKIYPVTLIQHGLGQAIERLADASPIPLVVSVAPGRWPLPVEITAYFVISESLANTYKHAPATRVAVTVAAREDQLIVEIDDNGRGGARILPGRGLAGLQDRVAAIGGTLRVVEQRAGTRIVARLPLESQ